MHAPPHPAPPDAVRLHPAYQPPPPGGSAGAVGACVGISISGPLLQGRIEVGTVVAFVSGLGKRTDPWGDMVNWFREMTAIRMRYRLLTGAMDWIGRSSSALEAAGPGTAT